MASAFDGGAALGLAFQHRDVEDLMHNRFLASLTAWLLAAASFVPFVAASSFAQAGKPESPKLKVGDMAPDFKLQYFDGTGLKNVDLSQYRGKQNVIVAFYVFAFTGG